MSPVVKSDAGAWKGPEKGLGPGNSAFLNVRQVAEYLQLNEKKVYALVREGAIPATKVTGKWLFPRKLVDRWLLDSAHGGLLADRLMIAGSDDPLLYRLVLLLAQETGSRALVAYSPTGTRLGLKLLQSGRADLCGIHWGPDEESETRHPALLKQHDGHRRWILVHAFRREQGILVRNPPASGMEELLRPHVRWALRQPGAGAQRYFLEVLSRHDLAEEGLNRTLTAYSERDAAAAVAMNLADAAPGARPVANEYGLGFVPFGWESFDLAMPREIWFRHLFQRLLKWLRSAESRALAERLGGYDLSRCGELTWGEE